MRTRGDARSDDSSAFPPREVTVTVHGQPASITLEFADRLRRLENLLANLGPEPTESGDSAGRDF